MNGADKRRMDELTMEVGVNEMLRRNAEECELRNWQRSAAQRLENNEARKGGDKRPRLARVTRMKPSESYVYRKTGREIVRVSCMFESLVRGTRTSDSELTTNEMTALS